MNISVPTCGMLSSYRWFFKLYAERDGEEWGKQRNYCSTAVTYSSLLVAYPDAVFCETESSNCRYFDVPKTNEADNNLTEKHYILYINKNNYLF